jgi:D-cysteine desulfhydrase family pyridoxal phosphate-dependent enzyme
LDAYNVNQIETARFLTPSGMPERNGLLMRLAAYPRFPLVTGPTPLQRAQRLEHALGPESPRIYIKRDDLTGLAYGGNKARKLEYLVADALSHRATVLVTEGVTQSNHARMTAAAALLAGLKCVLILDARNGAEEQGNLLLDRLMGADIRIVEGRKERIETMAAIADELREEGESPYVIPTGGSVPLGSLGYVRASLELDAQLLEIGESPSRVYFPTGSQGTLAGLVAGSSVLSSSWRPVAVAVEGTEEEIREDAVPHVQGTLALLQADDTIAPEAICIEAAYAGDGYGIPTTEGLEAIHLLARTEAIFLDPVYTGKAMSALIAHVRNGLLSSEESVVFIHTGGTPSLFVHRDLLLEGV